MVPDRIKHGMQHATNWRTFRMDSVEIMKILEKRANFLSRDHAPAAVPAGGGLI